jgi:predicted small metal-binding protein
VANKENEGRPEFSSDNPSINPQTGAIDPSSPTAGTEGWGNTTDERKTLSENPPSVARNGQTTGTEPAEASKVRGATAGSNITQGTQRLTYRCADAGDANCRWETSGSSEDEMMEKALKHGQTEHGWSDWTAAMSQKVRDAIRERAA